MRDARKAYALSEGRDPVEKGKEESAPFATFFYVLLTNESQPSSTRDCDFGCSS